MCTYFIKLILSWLNGNVICGIFSKYSITKFFWVVNKAVIIHMLKKMLVNANIVIEKQNYLLCSGGRNMRIFPKTVPYFFV